MSSHNTAIQVGLKIKLKIRLSKICESVIKLSEKSQVQRRKKFVYTRILDKNYCPAL